MNNYTISQMNKINQCEFRGYMSTFNGYGDSNKFLHLLTLAKTAMSSNVGDSLQ